MLTNTDAPKVTWYVPAFAMLRMVGLPELHVMPDPEGVLINAVNGTLVLLVTVVPEALPSRYK